MRDVMNDDLLIKFISGKTTHQETEIVAAYLSEHPQEAQEWLQMEQAARMADKKPAVGIPQAEAQASVAKVLGSVHTTPGTKNRVVRMTWIFGGVAAVAASVVLALMLIIPADAPSAPSATASVSESVIPSTSSSVIPNEVEESLLAEANAPAAPVIEPVAPSTSTSTPSSVIPSEVEKPSLTVSKIEKSTASASTVQTSFNITRPAKTPYRVLVKNPEKDFVFEWEGQGIATVSILIKNSQDGVIYENIVQDAASGCPVKSGLLMDKGELTWILTACFADGSAETKTGIIQLAGSN